MSGVRRRAVMLMVATVGAVFSSCTPDIVFVSDEYLYEIVVDEAFEQSARAIARDRDRRIRLSVVAESDDLVSATEADCYVFAPILRDLGLEYARESAALVYLIGPVEDEIPENTALVTFERLDAFRRAGSGAAELIAASEPEASIGAMILTDTEARRSEWDSFLEGFRETSGDSAVRSRLYTRQPRREELRRDVRDMITRGTSILVVSLAEQNAFVLDLLAGHDIRVITEDAAAAGGYEDKIVFSIERPLLSALALVVDSCVKEQSDPIVVPAELRHLAGRVGADTH